MWAEMPKLRTFESSILHLQSGAGRGLPRISKTRSGQGTTRPQLGQHGKPKLRANHCKSGEPLPPESGRGLATRAGQELEGEGDSTVCPPGEASCKSESLTKPTLPSSILPKRSALERSNARP